MAGYQPNNQKHNKMAANDGQLKVTIYRRFFNMNTGNGINIFDDGEGFESDGAVCEKHIINF